MCGKRKTAFCGEKKKKKDRAGLKLTLKVEK